MDYAYYSIYLILAFAFARYVSEYTSIHLIFKGLWIHHWILATLAMIDVVTRDFRAICLGSIDRCGIGRPT